LGQLKSITTLIAAKNYRRAKQVAQHCTGFAALCYPLKKWAASLSRNQQVIL